MTEYRTPGMFINRPKDGEWVCLCYEASTSGTIQQIVGYISKYAGMSEYTEITEEESGDVYLVYGYGLSDRELGDVAKNGRKVGTFDSAWNVNK